jgi:hypothetical protein
MSSQRPDLAPWLSARGSSWTEVVISHVTAYALTEDALYLVTGRDAPRYRVVAIPLPAADSASPTDVWAVGALGDGDDGALAEHWNGSAWSIVPTPALAGIGLFSSATAVGSSDVWAVGSQGSSTLTEHWDGSAWSIVSSPNPLPTYKGNNFLTAVTAVSSTDVWAVGATLDFTLGELEQTMTMRWDGTSWTVVTARTAEREATFSSVPAVRGAGSCSRRGRSPRAARIVP